LNAEGLLSQDLLPAVQRQISAFNFILFETMPNDFGKQDFIRLNQQFGLYHLDSNPGADDDRVTALRVLDPSDERAQYIPYTNRAMNWHTDGYYNSPDRRVNAFALYCVQPAVRGGSNYFFDHEMMYLLIRDQSPELLAALMADDLMRIPANLQGNQVIRAEESGPVFSLQRLSGALNMRYTSRPRNIVWKTDRHSQKALDLVREILMQGSCLVELQLQAGQGVICNNLLHGREAFRDAPSQPARLIYRARYYDAINLQWDSVRAAV
jgi:alpha-ketoglutarate-dependent taurine dioxygenase